MKLQCSEADLIKTTNSFIFKFQNDISLVFAKEILKNIRLDITFLNSLKNECGIYYFIQDNIVTYLGAALPSVGLRNRLFSQLNATGYSKWDQLITDDKLEIGVMLFKKEHAHLISDLEYFIVSKLGKKSSNEVI